MISGFQCFHDLEGNLHVTDGLVRQQTTGVVILVGSGGIFSANPPDPSGGFYQATSHAVGATFVGGSGRNLSATGLPAPTSAAPSPTGWFRPALANVFRNGIFTLTVTGSSAATIHDGTNTVAILSTGGTAPIGSYASTTYGATTYHGGVAFTLTIAGEISGGGAVPGTLVSISAGTAQGGDYSATSVAVRTSAVDSDWTLVLDASGSAELRHSGTAMAVRAAGVGYDPSGEYEATTAGKAAYNLTADEPVNGEPWRAHVQVTGRLPRAGVAYLEIVKTAGVLTAVNGPFFETTMPANFAGTEYYALAGCDGSALEQYHTGVVVVDSAPTWVTISADDFAALTTPDPGIIYDVTIDGL